MPKFQKNFSRTSTGEPGKRLFFLLVSVFFLGNLVLAGLAWTAPVEKKADPSVPPCPNYAEESSWAALARSVDKPVDVFYVYPTIYSDESPKNMDIGQDHLRARVMPLLKAQAGVFTQETNLFAPFYRQVSMAALDPDADMFQNRYWRIGACDVQQAFDYYLAHLNADRPFILAGHSQGSMVLLDLLRRRFYDPALQKRLVAAYLIGYSVTHEDLKRYPWLNIAQKADDTGVVITFNTQAPGATGSPVLLPGAVCVNPLSWTTAPTPADKALNLGAVFFKEDTGIIAREAPQYAGARIDPQTGALVTTPPDTLQVGAFPAGVFHKYDYAFWYRNLQQNVQERVRAFLEHHPSEK